jgi:hypothetical protein
MRPITLDAPNCTQSNTASCHAGQTVAHLITKVKQLWAQLVLGWVTAQMTGMLGTVRRCTRMKGLGKWEGV